MKRILFVDDDPLALAALENITRKHRRRWEMVFCGTASEAVAQLHWGSYDAIVTDLGLGGRGVDGDAVLNVARKKQPGAARIVLSGQMQIEAAYRALPYAHQWLSKPCEAHVLQNVIDRACALGELLGDKDRKSTRLNSSHRYISRMPSSA
jgi:DNA-binding NtrC family response regulator